MSPIQLMRWHETVVKLVRGSVLATVGFLVARIHIHVFDRYFFEETLDRPTVGARRP